ncbi:MAG: hypothetical protein O7D91_04560 [Planctomycetota bacterium]|nr:hypothetical protein [Planctomycetota bacterium]
MAGCNYSKKKMRSFVRIGGEDLGKWSYLHAAVRRLLLLVIGAMLISLTLGANCIESFIWEGEATVPADVMPDDFHAIFGFTGGTIRDAEIISDPNPQGMIEGMDNMVDITWSSALSPGDVVKFRFTTSGSGVDVVVAQWTVGGENVADADVDLVEVTAGNE